MTVKELLVKITGDSSGLDKSLQSTDKILGKFGVSIKDIEELINGPLGLVTAFGIAAKAAWDMGVKYDEAYASITKTTGKMGEDMDKLSFIFRQTMAGGIEQSIDEVSAAFGKISQRFEVSGGDLKKLTLLFGDFADVVGVDMSGAVEMASDVMRNWGIDSSDTKIVLDKLYKATTISGQSVADLSQSLTDSGTVLRQAGMDFEDSIAIISQFKMAGLDTTTMTTGLNTAIAKMAKEGKNAKTGINEAFDAIKRAKDPTEATTIAVETFGSKAGPKLVEAIRSGVFSLDSFNKKLKDSKADIESVAKESDTITDRFAVFKNQLDATGNRAGEFWIKITDIILDVLIPTMESMALFADIYFGKFVKAAEDFKNLFGPIIDAVTGYMQGVITFWSGVLSGNWTLVWTGILTAVLSVAKGIVAGVENMVVGAAKGVNWLIDRINEGIKVLKLPLEPLGKLSTETLGWSKAIQDTIDKLKDMGMASLDLDETLDTSNEKLKGQKKTQDDLADSTGASAEKLSVLSYESRIAAAENYKLKLAEDEYEVSVANANSAMDGMLALMPDLIDAKEDAAIVAAQVAAEEEELAEAIRQTTEAGKANKEETLRNLELFTSTMARVVEGFSTLDGLTEQSSKDLMTWADVIVNVGGGIANGITGNWGGLIKNALDFVFNDIIPSWNRIVDFFQEAFDKAGYDARKKREQIALEEKQRIESETAAIKAKYEELYAQIAKIASGISSAFTSSFGKGSASKIDFLKQFKDSLIAQLNTNLLSDPMIAAATEYASTRFQILLNSITKPSATSAASDVRDYVDFYKQKALTAGATLAQATADSMFGVLEFAYRNTEGRAQPVFDMITSSFESLTNSTRLEKIKSIGDTIGSALASSISQGFEQENIMESIGNILIDQFVTANLSGGLIGAQISAISELMLNGGVSNASAIKTQTSQLASTIESTLIPTINVLRGMFSTPNPTGFASGVNNFMGGVRTVGEQGPEKLYLPKGSSIAPNDGMKGGNSFIFNSPKALDPMTIKRDLVVVSRQLAWEGALT